MKPASLLVGTGDLCSKGIPVEIVSAAAPARMRHRQLPRRHRDSGRLLYHDGRQYREVVGIEFGCALTLLATVVNAPNPDQAVCDAGLKTLTREFGLPVVITRRAGSSWACRRSTAAGAGGRCAAQGRRQGRDDPIHGCTTINLHDEYHVIRGGVLEAIWPIAGRGR